MGGVLSAGSVAFGKPAAKREEVVATMLRGSIIGGMALFSINLIRCICAAVLGNARIKAPATCTNLAGHVYAHFYG